jgi:acyl-CoA hydrolase
MPGQQREVTLRFLAAPTDVNFGGKVHGGAVMSWIDQAGYACAAGWSGRYCVTAYVGGIQFERPISIGQLVEVHARVLHTGSSSMHIGIDVFARDPQSEERRRTTHCIVIFVAVDDARKPTAVPTYVPSNDAERELEQYVKRIAVLRQSIEAERSAFLSKFEGL